MKLLKEILYYPKRYPLSLLVIAAVIYLSFFKPPTDSGLKKIPHIDKIVHFGMYFGMSGMLWIEFIRSHKSRNSSVKRAWIGAFLCPVLFSGIVEVLQEYCTSYRGGDWLDFAANSAGALLASLIGCYLVRWRTAK